MVKFKTFLAFFSILSVSLCMLFMPKMITRSHNTNLTRHHRSWNYENLASANITAAQIASLYCEGQLDAIYSESLSFKANDTQLQHYLKSASLIFEEIFEKNSRVTTLLQKELADDSLPDISKRSILTVIDNRAVVLNLISVNTRRTHMIFEEKTNTIIAFSFYSKDTVLDSASQTNEKEIHLAVTRYYENLLRDTPYTFYYLRRTNLGDEESEKYDCMFTDFGLLKVEKTYGETAYGSYIIYD